MRIPTIEAVEVKELRQNFDSYIAEVEKGASFVITRHSRAVFKIIPPKETETWERVIDFTSVKKGGLPVADLLSRL